jgi:hypothetical protein
MVTVHFVAAERLRRMRERINSSQMIHVAGNLPLLLMV